MKPQRGAVGDRLDDLLEDPVGEQDDHAHRERGLQPLGAESDQSREDPGGPGADVRDVGSQEVDHGDRSHVGNAKRQRAESDHDGVEGRHDGHAREIAL